MNERRRRSRHRSRGSITGTSSQRLRWQRLPLRDFLGNAGLREAWNRLNGSRGGLPFLDIEVVDLACQAFRPKGVELLLGEVSGQPQCMMLLQRQGLGRWQLYQPAQIPLGLIVAASSLSLEGIANSALRFLGFPSLVLSFTQLDPRDWSPPHEVSTCFVKRYISTGWIDCRQDFDTYWAARSANLRASVGKAQRRLESEGRRLQVRILTSPLDMADAVARYGALESAGWKGRKGTAVAPGTPQASFYTRWLTAAAERGEARVYELVLQREGEPEQVLAADLCVVRGESLVLLKIAYDEAFERYSPSTLLRREFLHDLFGHASIRRIEFFGRMMDWHRRWTSEQRSLYHLTTFRWEWLAKLRAPSSDAL